MTLSTLIFRIAIAAIILTFGIGFWKKITNSYTDKDTADDNSFLSKIGLGYKDLLMTFCQYFVGILFVFSGFVKAVDPLGTSYKLVDYFTEFETTFEPTWFSFLAPLFPFLSEYSVSLSVFTIIFEIILGIMLILGARSKFTSWAFLALIIFFTFLTGFTYLTGYVPNGGEFFDFASWGPYATSNMRVTDCGCFGDFIKLEPKTSFFKDIFLLIPGLFFVWKHRNMEKLFNVKVRDIIVILSSVALLAYCMSNYVWDLPSVDFRPFKEGNDVRAMKLIEEEAQANVKITHYVLENKESKEVLKLEFDNYLKNFANYPKTEWTVLDQLKSEPSIKSTKISEYSIEDPETGDEIGQEMIDMDGYSLMMVAYMLKGDAVEKIRMVSDTTFLIDTIQIFEEGIGEQQKIVKSVENITPREETYYDMVWEDDYLAKFKKKINPLAVAAKNAGIAIYGVVGKADKATLTDFKMDSGLDMTLYKSDDILLKTIVRSNPGIVLWKDGRIVKKWHYNKLPDFNTIKSNYIK